MPAPLRILLFFLLVLHPASCCKRSFEVSIQRVATGLGSGGICYPLCPVIALQDGENTTFSKDDLTTGPYAAYGSFQEWCEAGVFLDGGGWTECQNLTYTTDTIPANIKQGLSLLYHGDTVCGQLVTRKATVVNSTAHVSWGLDRQCRGAEDGEKLLDFRYMVWDLSVEGGESGDECDEHLWTCDEGLVTSVLVWGGAGHGRASAGMVAAGLAVNSLV